MSRPAATPGTRRAVNGYVRVRTEDGWEYEHVVAARGLLGRPLRAGERVEWVDGDRSNNRPENLRVVAEVVVAGVPSRDDAPGAVDAICTRTETLREAHLAYQRAYLRDWRARRKARA